jgi:hypothetical protein
MRLQLTHSSESSAKEKSKNTIFTFFSQPLLSKESYPPLKNSSK